MSIWRAITDTQNLREGEHFTNTAVLIKAQQLAIENAVGLKRILFAVRLFMHAPPPLIRIVITAAVNPKSWVVALTADLKHLYSTCKSFLPELPDPTVSIAERFQSFREAPRMWSSVCQKASKQYVDNLGNDISDLSLYVCSNIEQPEHFCSECTKAFDTKVQLLSHRSKMHGYRSPLAMRICTTHCPSCCVEFHSRHRLISHLRRHGSNNKCAVAVLMLPPFELDEVLKIEKHVADVKKTTGKKQLLKPATRVYDAAI